MKPQEVIEIIYREANEMGFIPREVRMIQRLFLRRMFSWLTLQKIGELTGVKSHQTVMYSIETVDGDLHFQIVKRHLTKLFMNANLPSHDLAEKVKAMRDAQRAYFANRTADNLSRSKKLEREVDELIAKRNQTQLPLVQ